MKGQFLFYSTADAGGGAFGSGRSANIFADRSALVIEWLLACGVDRDSFTVREVARERRVSTGLVQRVFSILVAQGILATTGVRTSKRFLLKNAEKLLKNWLASYLIVEKCRMRTYRSGFANRDELLAALSKEGLCDKVTLALHSAADASGFGHTNLQTLELYLNTAADRMLVEKALKLDPQERGYEVLLIEPYYKALLGLTSGEGMVSPPLLLTYLDLYHFPLRGREQADFIARQSPTFKPFTRKR